MQDGQPQRAVRQPLAQHDAARAELHEPERHRLAPLVARRPHDARPRGDLLLARVARDDAQRVPDLPDDRVADAGPEAGRTGDGRREHQRDERDDRDVLDRPLAALGASARHGTSLDGAR